MINLCPQLLRIYLSKNINLGDADLNNKNRILQKNRYLKIKKKQILYYIFIIIIIRFSIRRLIGYAFPSFLNTEI
jgi:hypothetical protein